MRSSGAALFVVLTAGLAAGCGGSQRAIVPTDAPTGTVTQPWVRHLARGAGRDFGDPHATVRRIEVVQLATGIHADVIEVRGRFHFLPTCVPGAAGHCPSVVRFHNVQAIANADTHGLLMTGNDVSDEQLTELVHARRASPFLRAFPDFTEVVIDCRVPTQLVPGGVPGTCTTWTRPVRRPGGGTRTHVLFIAHWPLTKPSGTRNVGGWAVTFSPNGRIVAVHRFLHRPPQTWR